ncbi:MAG: aldose epimerase family protein [Christensenellales bacterium]|jgi:aldose 1-epimerase
MANAANIWRDTATGLERYRLENDVLRLELTNAGAAMISLYMNAGEARDLILGYDNTERYLDNQTYFGAVVGRFAGIIPNAVANCDGEEFRLTKNDGEHHLHGGVKGLSFRLWRADIDGDTLCFRYESRDGEEGYPGKAEFEVRYRLVGNRIEVEYAADCDRPCPLNLTLHPYFNLNGHACGCLDGHMLRIGSSRYFKSDAKGAAIKGEIPAQGGYNFQTLMPLQDIAYDNYYIVDDGGYAAELYAEPSGIIMRLSCTQPGIQLYSADGLMDTGKGGVLYGRRSGICLEPQEYPWIVNPNLYIRYHHKIQYEFDYIPYRE